MKQEENKVNRICILVVHGIGEQKRFEHLEVIASHLYKALGKDPNRKPHIQVLHGDQVPRHSSEHSWRESPVRVRWKAGSGDWIEVRLREVHWADLDMPMTLCRWFRLVGWALSISGVRLFTKSNVESSAMTGMVSPLPPPFWERVFVRPKLFGVSLLFLLILSSIDLLYVLLTRFSFRVQILKKTRGVLYDYLGDVKLYQDGFERKDEAIEAIGDLSRVAIRRRMVRTLIQTTTEVERGALDGYFVFAHSLGSVVAFNALMEHALTLPNYLTEEEWNALPTPLKGKAPPIDREQMPRRPPWLQPTDAIDRDRLFSGLRGFLTWGSPLDKFATLWPAIVPVNRGQPIPGDVPWINVADIRDLVAGSIDLFQSPGSPPCVGGLRLENFVWADQPTPLSAHTSYWTVRPTRDRLMDRLIPWLEGGRFVPPKNDSSLCRTIGFVAFCGAVLAVSTLILWVEATGVIWAFGRFGHPLGSVGRWMGILFLANALVVLICSFGRRVWEWKALRLPS